MSKPAVAYIAREDWEGHCCVVFHNHGLAARRIGANELDIEFDDCEISRAPQFDQWAAQGWVPPTALIRDGWWFECFHCGRRLPDDDDDNEIGVDKLVERGPDQLYCGSECAEAHDARVSEQNARAEAFEARARKARPDLTWKRFEGRWPSLSCYATFDFTGCKHGGSVRQDPGSDDLEWSIATGDLDAWHEYERQRKEAVSTGNTSDDA